MTATAKVVDSATAAEQLVELFAAAIRGETILIAVGEGRAVQLVPIPTPHGQQQSGNAGEPTTSGDADAHSPDSGRRAR
jgi:antitoxin (DNA-binding transcriptional repressor) of toxin-antitoxin stability system